MKLIFLILLLFTTKTEDKILLDIKHTLNGNLLIIEAYAINNSNEQINCEYNLIVTKDGQSKSHSQQSGKKILETKSENILSQLILNYEKNADYKSELIINYNGGNDVIIHKKFKQSP